MLSGGNFPSSLARQSGGERQQRLRSGLIPLLATCFASRLDIGTADRCPLPSHTHLEMRLLGRRPGEGWRRVRVAGDTRRQPNLHLHSERAA